MGRTWTLVAIVLAGIGACAALWMLIYVLIKICDGTLSGQQTLGLLMLVDVLRKAPAPEAADLTDDNF